ncbi:MAG TPA: tetratricopeptide repeat protein [Terriglobia bacterium]|nr:tetratricopeptide repeat protein [Terriglobia bacterium]
MTQLQIRVFRRADRLRKPYLHPLIAPALLIWLAGAAQAAPPQKRTADLFQQARVYERQQHYAAAASVYREVLALHPGDPEALKRLGIVEQTEFKFNDSIEIFKRVLREHPDYPQVNFFLGLSCYGLHDFNNAITSFQDELKTPAPHHATRYYLALVLEAEGRADQAIAQLDQAAVQNPNNPNILYELARLHMDASFQAIERLRKVAPDSFQTHALLGELYANEGHDSAAIDEYKTALVKQPDAAGIHYSLGVAYWMLKQLGPAEKEFLLALRESPDDPQTNIYLGDIALRQQQFSSARDYLKRAETVQPGTAQIHLLLGRCYMGLNQLQEAKAELLLAARLEPKDPSSHYLLSQVYQKLHQPGERQRELAIFNSLSSAQNSKDSGANQKKPAD